MPRAPKYSSNDGGASPLELPDQQPYIRQRRYNQPAQLVLTETPLFSNDEVARGTDFYTTPSPLTSFSDTCGYRQQIQSASLSPLTVHRSDMTLNSVTETPRMKLNTCQKLYIPMTSASAIAALPLTMMASTNLGDHPMRAGMSSSCTGVCWEARRHSSAQRSRATTSLHFQGGSQLDLGDRTGSKLTLNEELFDILYAFGEADAGGDGEAEEEDDADEKRGKPMTRQYLLNKIRQKKEVINKLRCQPWSMNRKRRTLRLAQKYVEQNESKVSRAHLYKEELVKRWRAVLRWASNISIYLIPWESKIKKIESQFGSVVSSYFTFLRWVIFMNLILTLIIATLIVIPEFLADATADEERRNRTFTRKEIPAEEKPHADEIQVVWHYGGYLRYSPLFYGYYANEYVVGQYFSYPIPLAYFLGTLVVFACSFIAILRKMASNARMSKLAGSKTEQYIFNWKVFTGWDYSIGNAETASNTAMAAVIKLRETINECYAEQSKRIRPVQVIIRIITNLVILGMIAFSIYCIHAAVQSSEAVEQTGSGSLLTKNQELDEGVLFPKSSIVPSVVSTITHVFPIIFDLIGKIEKHHPKMQLRLHLFRVLTLYVINYATLIFALFEKLDNIRDITRTVDEDEHRPRHVRTAAFTRTYILPTQPFLSRNFTGEAQFRSRFRFGELLQPAETQSPRRPPTRERQPITVDRTIRPFVRVFTPPVAGWHLAGRKEKLPSWSRRKRQTFQHVTMPDDRNGQDDQDQADSDRNRATTISASFSVASENVDRTVGPAASLDSPTLTVTASFQEMPSENAYTDSSSMFNHPSSSYASYLPSSSTTYKPKWRTSSASKTPSTTTVRAKETVVTVDGSQVMINAQFGPVGVNNPTILMRNATLAPTPANVNANYETRRLGPTPLPVFTPPPLPATESQPTFRKHDWGPDWSISTKNSEQTEFDSISFGDVVKVDTASYSELNDNNLRSDEDEKNNGSTVAVISSEVGDQGHYNDHICWETVIGQEIVKLVTMDLYYTIVSILVIDFFRGYWIRYCSSWWCWDIETTFPEYGEFKVAENVLHIINNQGMIWLGLFFAPLLPAVNNVKLIIIIYIRAWACMTCNVPAREIFRASRSSNFFLMILLLWLLLCTLPVGYVITSKRPSTICGPFAGKDQFYEVITKIIEANVSKKVIRWLKYVASPGVIIPIILLLMLIIFFLVSLVRGLREANTDLQKQLVHERTEEKKKIFELAGGGKQKKPSGFFFSKFQPKKQVQHIPGVERKRREPWRQYNGTDRAASLCPTDEPASSPMSEESKSPMSPASWPVLQLHSTRSGIIHNDAELDGARPSPDTVYAFRSPLRSVEEGSISTKSTNIPKDQSTSSFAVRDVRWPAEHPKSIGFNMSKSVSAARSGQTDRADDVWSPENEPSGSSDDIAAASDTSPSQPPAVDTPDDLRSQYAELLRANRADSSGSHPPAKMSHSGTFPRGFANNIDRGSNVNTAAMSHSFHINAPALPFGGHPAPETQQRISIYAKEPRRIGKISIQQTGLSGSRINTTVNVHSSKEAKPEVIPTMSTKNAPTGKIATASGRHASRKDIDNATSGRKDDRLVEAKPSNSVQSAEPKRDSPSKSPSKKFNPTETTEAFMPWPSIEEVKAKRSNFFKHQSGSSDKRQNEINRRLPSKLMTKSAHGALEKLNRNEPDTSQPTRFRISVSPTRRLRPGNEASNSEEEAEIIDDRLHRSGQSQQTAKPRFIVKQQLMPGSTSSFGSRISTDTTAAMKAEIAAQIAAQMAAATASAKTSRRQAPKIEFGEDDSPRVESLPKLP